MPEEPPKSNVASAALLKMCGQVENLNMGQIISFGLLGFVFLFFTNSAFLLGVVLTLPTAVVSLVNEKTIFHLSSNFALIILLSTIVWKISRIVALGVLVQIAFFASKKLAWKRRRPTKRKALLKWQSWYARELYESALGRNLLVTVQTLTLLLFLYYRFFQIPRSISVSLNIFYLGIIIAAPLLIIKGITGLLAVRNVGSKISHIDFVGMKEGRQLAIAIVLLVCFSAGIMRSYALMYGPSALYTSSAGSCELGVLFPVFEGVLFYDAQSKNFLVQTEGEGSIHIPSAHHSIPSNCPEDF